METTVLVMGSGVSFFAGLVLIYFVQKVRSYQASAKEKSEACAKLTDHLAHLQKSHAQEHDQRLIFEEKARKVDTLETIVETLRTNVQRVREEKIALEHALQQERSLAKEKIYVLEKAQVEFQNAFKVLSSEALSKNNQSFLELAKTTLGAFQESAKSDIKATERAFSDLVTPVKEALGTVNQRIEAMEKSRVGAYEGLKEQVNHLLQSQKDLRGETANLVKALRAPNIRGRWGEMQLRRVVEMSGMSTHCDFVEQTLFEGEDGGLRPDMIVNLPNDKKIIIDSKVPLGAYLEAIEAQTEALRVSFLKNHARQVRSHIHALSSKAYWDHLKKQGTTPEFVVLFIPSDPFFSAALEYDASLIEEGVQKSVILSTPSTLIALLHAVAYGWRQESLAENARAISQLGQELYNRCADVGTHLNKLGKDLKNAVLSYNSAVGSMEHRFLPAARRFKDLQVGSRKEILPLPTIDSSPRDVS